MPELIEDRGDFLYETTIPFTECRDFRQYLDKCRGSSTLESRRQFESNDALSVPEEHGAERPPQNLAVIGVAPVAATALGRLAFLLYDTRRLAAYAAAGFVPLIFKSAKVKGSPLCCSS